ncbi:MAG: glycosyltransferase [Thermoplasmatota archaeon]|jgi:glycosyltransferase involved in cell wall biosynthesis
MFKPKISLVIPAYNEEKYIRPTLESVKRAKSLYEDSMKEKVEVIVVDNDSTDKTVEIAKEYGCKVVRFKKHNIAAVRNAGAKKANGEYIAFVDADSSIIPEDTFINIHKNLEKKEVFGGGSRMRPDKINSLFGFFGFGLVDLLLYYIFVDLRGLGLVLFYLRKKDFKEIKGFDESLWILEDADFGKRMKETAKKKNQRLAHLKKPVIVSTRKNDTINFSDMFRSYFKILKKNSIKKEENVHDMFYNIDNLR